MYGIDVEREKMGIIIKLFVQLRSFLKTFERFSEILPSYSPSYFNGKLLYIGPFIHIDVIFIVTIWTMEHYCNIATKLILSHEANIDQGAIWQ